MRIQEVTCLSQSQNYNISKTKPQNDNRFIKTAKYNPVYYKPQNISFKGKVFGSYFPSDILGMKEEDFDRLILKIIQDKDTRKRDILADYIVKTVSKKANAMDFVNMWKRQVPTLITPGMIAVGGSSGSAAMSKALNIAARNSSNSMIDKFYASDFQSEVLMKDGKNAVGGLLAYKLFAMASADPEPYTKAGLYAAGLAVSIGTYSLNRSESKKIQDQQFLNATKECMRLGALDPYLLLGKISPSLINGVDKNEYKNWLNTRIENLRMIKTGSKVDKSGDFNYDSAKNVLDKVLFVMSSELNMEDEKIASFLSLLGAVYKSSHETADAYYITDKIRQIQENMFDNDKNRYLNYMPLYDTYIELADLQKTQEEYIRAIYSLLKAEKVAINCFGENSQQVFDINLKILDYIQEQKKYNDTIIPFIEAEAEVSQNEDRASRHKYQAESLKEYNMEEKVTYHGIEDLTYYEYNDEYSSIRVLNRILKLINDNPKFAAQFDTLLEIIEKYPTRKAYTILMNNVLQPNINPNLPQIAEKQLPDLYKSMGGVGQDAASIVRKAFLYYMLTGKTNFRKVAEELSKKDDKPENEPEFYHLVAKNTDYREIEDTIFNKSAGKSKDKCITPHEGFYNIEYSQYPDEYGDFLKVLYDWKYHFDSSRYLFEGKHYTPDYTSHLNSRLEMMEFKYGYNSDKTMQALIDCIKSPMFYDISDSLLTYFIQNANSEMKKKYSAQIYEAHADKLYRRLKHSESIDDTEMTEGVISYKRAIENSKSQNPLLIYKYLNFIDFANTRQVINSVEGYSFGLRFNSTYNPPIIKEINGMEREQGKREFSKGHYGWSHIEDELQELVKSCPGPFRINERKFLQMQKKYKIVFFENRFKRQKEAQIAQIESTLGQYEAK